MTTSGERELLERLETMEGNWRRERGLNEKAQRQASAAYEDLANALRREDELKAKISKARERSDAEINALIAELELRDKTIADLEEQLARSLKSNSPEEWGVPAYQQAIFNLRAELEGRDQEIAELKKGRTILQEIASLRTQLQASLAQRAGLTGSLALAEREIEERDETIESLERLLALTPDEIEELRLLEKRAKKQDAEIASLEAQGRLKNQVIDSLNCEVKEHREARSKEASEVARLEAEVASLESALEVRPLPTLRFLGLGYPGGLGHNPPGTKPEQAEEVPHETTHVLDRARDLICGDRARDYGEPSVSFAQIAAAWQAYLSAKQGPLDGRDVAQLMVIFKSVRDAIRRKSDNLVDQAGYAQCAAWVGE